MSELNGDTSSRRRTQRSRKTGSRRSSAPSYNRTLSGSRGSGSRKSGISLSGGGRSGRGLETREVVIFISLAAIFILLLVLVFNGIRGCVAGHSSTPTTETQVQTEEELPAVNENVSEALAAALTSQLDINDQLAVIARDANKYGSENLVYLALEEKAAVPFVSAYPTASREALEFSDNIKKGTVPKFYTYDSRWGYTDFAGDAFAITGSGPTCVSMAYMGLTGSSSRTPNALAELATTNKYIDGNTVNAAFFNDGVNSINGMACNQVESGVVGLSNALANGNVVVIKLPANSPLGSFARYVLAVSMSDDGSAVVVHDPMSTENSSHEWALYTLASSAEAMYSIQATETPTD